MKPPQIANPYAEPPPPRNPASPLKVLAIIGAVLFVLGFLFVGSVTALAVGIYYLSKPVAQNSVAEPTLMEKVDDDLRLQAERRATFPFGTVDLATEPLAVREARLATAVARLEQPVVTVQEATRLAEQGDWIDYQRALNGMRKQSFPNQGTREQLQSLADKMEARLKPIDDAWALDDRAKINRWKVRAGLVDANGNSLEPSGDRPTPVAAKTPRSAPASGDLTIKKAAVAKLREALKNSPSEAYVVIGVDVDAKSCTGFTYRMTVESKPSSLKHSLGRIQGLPVAIERQSLDRLAGATLDYVEVSDNVQGFVFDNPNQTKGTLSAPGDTKVATTATSVNSDAERKAAIDAISAKVQDVRARSSRLATPVTNLQEAIKLAENGDEIDYQRVLAAMKQKLFMDGSRDEHEQLADRMEDRLKELPLGVSAARATIRAWRRSAAVARLHGDTSAPATNLPPQVVEKPASSESGVAAALSDAARNIGASLRSRGAPTPEPEPIDEGLTMPTLRPGESIEEYRRRLDHFYYGAPSSDPHENPLKRMDRIREQMQARDAELRRRLEERERDYQEQRDRQQRNLPRGLQVPALPR